MIVRTDRLVFAVSMVLVFVWSLPGTIALRTLLLLTALALLTIRTYRLASADLRANLHRLSIPLGLVAILTLWFIIQAVAISGEAIWALGELRGQWLPALIALLIGLLLATSAKANLDVSRLLASVILIFTLLAALGIAQVIAHWLEGGPLFSQQVPLTGGKLEMSYLINLQLALVLADIVSRAGGHPALTRLPLALLLGCLAIALVETVLAGARNGVLTVLVMGTIAVGIALIGIGQRPLTRRVWLAIVAILAIGLTFSYTHVRSANSWQVFGETAVIAWDIDSHDAWRVEPSTMEDWPQLADGRMVDPSAYYRIAFIHAGLRMLGTHPWGVGYGRNAFQHALLQHYPPDQTQVGHAHSGWIDLGIGGGWPALLLWVTFLGTLALCGIRAWTTWHNAAGLALVLLAAGFGFRMLLDSVMRDHMLQMFFFLAALLAVPATRGSSR